MYRWPPDAEPHTVVPVVVVPVAVLVVVAAVALVDRAGEALHLHRYGAGADDGSGADPGRWKLADAVVESHVSVESGGAAAVAARAGGGW